MMTRMQELCRKLKPVLGSKVDGLWRAYVADSDADGKADIEQTLELLAAKHLGTDYQPDRSPFPPLARTFAALGDITTGMVSYGTRELYPFALQSGRLKEHVLIAGRSGSGKTNLSFVLMQGIMNRGVKILALDWKRAYRDLLSLRSDLRVYTIGREVAPFRFNPFIPPPGCEVQVWTKLIVDVIASAYLGGEGVISLLIAGLDRLYQEARDKRRWPTVIDLLAWLRTVKLRGRAAMWQASAERILLAMTYGEFGAVLNTQDNSYLQHLLDHNVILEMDGLSSSSDRVMFSEAITLYLYRYRLSLGPREQLTNVIVLEEAHNLLLAKQTGTKESGLETSIRMIRQYGLGYVFVDQSASLLSRVAFANSYVTFALSQKLRADIKTMSGAMNLSEEQEEALSTLPIGSAVVRLADEHPEPFLIRIPRCSIREGSVSDSAIQRHMATYSAESAANSPPRLELPAVPPLPAPDKNIEINPTTIIPHPPSPERSRERSDSSDSTIRDTIPDPPHPKLSRETIRFLTDIAARPLSTTVSRYQRLHLSRRKGNAIRHDLLTAGIIEAVPLATRTGQVMLFQLTDPGRQMCNAIGVDPGPPLRASLEHQYWAHRVAEMYEKQGYEVALEHAVAGDGIVDVVAERAGERLAVEIETGKSDIKMNIEKTRLSGFDRVILVATSPSAVSACQRALDSVPREARRAVELVTWLDVA